MASKLNRTTIQSLNERLQQALQHQRRLQQDLSAIQRDLQNVLDEDALAQSSQAAKNMERRAPQPKSQAEVQPPENTADATGKMRPPAQEVTPLPETPQAKPPAQAATAAGEQAISQDPNEGPGAEAARQRAQGRTRSAGQGRVRTSRPAAMPPRARKRKKPKEKSSLEKFIGENILSIVGVLLTIIGVGIGVKYAIDNEMISPLMRCVLGYGVGLGLAAFGMRLRKSYENFAAVLVSGAMAVMYFVTYTAGVSFELISLPLTFGLMWLITALTVYAAFLFDRQVIAHIGLAGAYIVPFLLSTGSGNVLILFSYMAIINCGILLVALFKQWRPLHLTASMGTWLIVLVWFLFEYDVELHYGIALTFVPIFFAQFFAMVLGYKVRAKSSFNGVDILRLYSNAFLMFGLIIATLRSHPSGAELLGLFTVLNAILYFGVVWALKRLGTEDKLVESALYALSLLFLTLAVPIELDGNHITLAWTAEALIFFALGRMRGSDILEYFAYPVFLLSLLGVVAEWTDHYAFAWITLAEPAITPIFNVACLTGIFFLLALIGIVLVDKRRPSDQSDTFLAWLANVLKLGAPGLLLVMLYAQFALEIFQYWGQNNQTVLALAGEVVRTKHELSEFHSFALVWLLIYSMTFVATLLGINQHKLRVKGLETAGLVVALTSIVVFLTLGIFGLNNLRMQYQAQLLPEFVDYNFMYIAIRYLAFASLAGLILMARRALAPYLQVQRKSSSQNGLIVYHLSICVVIFVCVSNELITWMELANSEHTYKLGLTILWALFALSMIIAGTARGLKHIRIAAIVLLAFTLIKLFFYDITRMDTIPKVLLFLAIGITTTIGSFFYNKLRRKLADELEENNQASAQADTQPAAATDQSKKAAQAESVAGRHVEDQSARWSESNRPAAQDPQEDKNSMTAKGEKDHTNAAGEDSDEKRGDGEDENRDADKSNGGAKNPGKE